MFDLFAGLPLHPLVVHAVVVLLPLSAVGMILLLLRPQWRRPYGWLVIGGLGASAASALVARLSGEALQRRVGDVGVHSTLGTVTAVVAAALFALATAWWILWRRQDAAGGRVGIGTTVCLWASAVLAVGSLVAVGLTGHSGSTAAWSDVVTTPTPAATPAATPSAAGPDGSPTPSASAVPAASESPANRTYTMRQVATHDSQQSCWAVVDGDVYDLTAWIARHPGGPQRILGLCGTDATARFRQQHDTQTRPNSALARFRIGTLS